MQMSVNNVFVRDSGVNIVHNVQASDVSTFLKKDFDAASLILDDHRMRTYKEIKIKLENI